MKRFIALIAINIVIASLSVAGAETKKSDVTVSEEDFPSDSDKDRAARKLIEDVRNDPDRELMEKVNFCAGQARLATRPFGRIDANKNPFYKEGGAGEKIIVKGNTEGISAYNYCMYKMKDRTLKKKISKQSRLNRDNCKPDHGDSKYAPCKVCHGKKEDRADGKTDWVPCPGPEDPKKCLSCHKKLAWKDVKHRYGH